MAMKILSNIDFKGMELLNARLHLVAGNPSSPEEGLIWYDSSAKQIKFYNGTQIEALGIAGGGGDADTLNGLAGSHYLDRTNHSGTQSLTTITDHDKDAHDSLNIDADTLDGLDATDLEEVANKGVANGYASLDANAKVPSAQLPALSLSEVYVVADITARDALDVQEGDWAIVTDAGGGQSITYVYDGTDWQEITSDALIDSVNGQTGTVVLDTSHINSVTDLRYATDAQLTKVDSLPSGPLSYAQDVGDGSTSTIVVTHNLGTRDVTVTVYESASPYNEVMVNKQHSGTNSITLAFANAPASNEYRVVVRK